MPHLPYFPVPQRPPVPPDPYSQNRALWNERAAFHLQTEMYQRFVQRLRDGGDALLPLEKRELGDLRGLRVLHLQCHVGTDTLSLARLGANATGVDFSSVAIDKARTLAEELGIRADFACHELHELPPSYHGTFDLVFTSYGVLCWLQDLTTWATTIAECLRPGGRFYIVDGHPLAMALAEDSKMEFEGLRLRYPYLDTGTPLRFDEEGSYADADATTKHNSSVEWVHSVADVVQAMLGAGLQVESLGEHAEGYYPILSGIEQGDDGHWRLPAPLSGRYPLTFSLSARKPG